MGPLYRGADKALGLKRSLARKRPVIYIHDWRGTVGRRVPGTCTGTPRRISTGALYAGGAMQDADPRRAIRRQIDNLHFGLRGEKLSIYLNQELTRFLSLSIEPTREGMSEACRWAERLNKEFARAYGNGPTAVSAQKQIWQKLVDAPDPSFIKPTPSKRKNLGGRPPKFNWDAFWCHIVEIANTPDGLPDRAELQRHMMDWCAEQWDDTPA